MSRRRERSECPTPNRKGPPMPALSLVRSYSSFQGWPGEENHEARGSLCVGEVGRDKGRTDVGEQPGLLAMDPQPCAHSLGLPGCPHPLLSKHAPVCQGLSKTAQPPRVLGNRRLTGQAPLASCGPSFPGCRIHCVSRPSEAVTGGQPHTDHRKPGPNMLACREGLRSYPPEGLIPLRPGLSAGSLSWSTRSSSIVPGPLPNSRTPVADLCSGQTHLLPLPGNHFKPVRISRPHLRGLCPGVRELGQPWLEQHP